MVFNSLIIASVAHKSADAWQQIARIQLQDRLSSHQLLDLICCFPLQQLGSFALWLWTFLCLPPPDSFYPYSYYSSSSEDDDQPYLTHALASSSSSSSSLDLGDYYHDSHSD
ncbi:hypothetical protein P3X46_026771 [Hevea brasiliensis]|uniref:Uncharacterized protein n=1 Tax=Hevea brasiliensis TaxID=3981 RepID=A0ABQ9KZ38_HEVBR|nr:uncharacterized protein LOC110632286 [Hevea brasiliensis]KAJ9153321.1 hypothetical protein P3X46_026771 [Hevea brasiliensis]